MEIVFRRDGYATLCGAPVLFTFDVEETLLLEEKSECRQARYFHIKLGV